MRVSPYKIDYVVNKIIEPAGVFENYGCHIRNPFDSQTIATATASDDCHTQKIQQSGSFQCHTRTLIKKSRLYGWLSNTHREAIVCALQEPLRPSQIKRRLRQIRPHVRISADNIRDCLQLLLRRRIVRVVSEVGKRYLYYTLTPSGRNLQRLLRSARRS